MRNSVPTSPTCTWAKPVETAGERLTPEELVERHSGLVYAIANKLKKKLSIRVSLEDLEAYGFQGLLQAYERFDSSQGEFSTYAYWRIRGAIIDGCRREGWMSHHSLRRARALEGIDEFSESAHEAQKTDQAPRTFDEALDRVGDFVASAGVIVMMDEVDEEFLEDPTQEDKVEKQQEKQLLKQGLRLLSEQEREVIIRFYFKEESMGDIGAHFGHTKSWTSRIHTRAIEKIRDHFVSHET